MKNIVVALLLAGLVGCECEPMLCPGLNPKDTALVPYRLGQLIRFENGNGRSITLRVDSFYYALDRMVECEKGSKGQCQCEPCFGPVAYAGLNATDSTVWQRTSQPGSFEGEDFVWQLRPGTRTYTIDSLEVSCRFLNDFRGFSIKPNFQTGFSRLDTLLLGQQLGNRTYNEIAFRRADTAQLRSRGLPVNIREYYISPAEGLVGFYDIRTNSLFYRL